MAQNKNQHFVPRAHLKPFSENGEGKAINLLLTASGRHIPGASVRGQCARPYFHGANCVLEKQFGEIEGSYAAIVRGLSNPGHRLQNSERHFLRYFTLLQSLRTAAQIERVFEQMIKFTSFVRLGAEAHRETWDPSNNPTLDAAKAAVFEAFNEQLRGHVLDDLKVVILHNRTARDFVTCDDPAVTTNRWLIQQKGVSKFGTSAAGLVLILPLGPRMLSLVYDAAVYSVATDGPGRVELTKEIDVLAFNEHQYMRAVESVYFRRAEEAGLIAAEFEAAKFCRPEAWDTFDVAKLDGGTEVHDRYVIGKPEDVANADDTLFHSASKWPTPPRSPSMLRYRPGAHGFTKGSTIVRRAMIDPPWSGSPLYRKVL